MGYQMCQLLATLYVTSSLPLVTMGGSDPSSGFCLQTLSLRRPPAIEEPIGDMAPISLIGAAGAMCKE
jgi:hypothetical protein